MVYVTTNLSVGACDSAGNFSNTSNYYTYTLDNTAPTITITQPNTTPALSKTITASASDGTLYMTA